MCILLCIILLVYDDFVTFTPPLFSDAGNYWCRNKTNHSDMAEGKLLFKGIYSCKLEAISTAYIYKLYDGLIVYIYQVNDDFNI